MLIYIAKRLSLIPLTLFGIMLINFLFVQLAPGGPVEQMIAKIQGFDTNAVSKISGGISSDSKINVNSNSYKNAAGLPDDIIKEIEKQFGFDKPLYQRFFIMIKDYSCFNFGKSFYQDETVLNLIKQRLPVSISLGIWSTLIIYLISIPLGIYKAIKSGSKIDVLTSWIIIIGYSIPSFLLAIFLIVIFCGGNYLDWFPLKGMFSDNFSELSLFHKIKDYFWHLTLPIFAIVAGGFAELTMLTKNSFMDEINKQYVIVARAKGLSENKILYNHIFRNAMLIIIAGFPSALVNMLFTASVLIEVTFSLDGLGLLGYEAVMSRDYPVIFGTLFIFGVIGLILNLISDIIYTLIDPRINFEAQNV